MSIGCKPNALEFHFIYLFFRVRSYFQGDWSGRVLDRSPPTEVASWHRAASFRRVEHRRNDPTNAGTIGNLAGKDESSRKQGLLQTFPGVCACWEWRAAPLFIGGAEGRPGGGRLEWSCTGPFPIDRSRCFIYIEYNTRIPSNA
ncbi:hypothetical protein Taro_026836 [Colocasia esculenta]|uniref:Uncharacterized protein n=1 Tax=Colocasia esculenta TaxID=4460 RepID=A0A843VLU2_COLES|nr:hypothetical protein [Colocasia esculenta]